MATRHSGGEGECQLEILHVAGVDLVERAVTSTGKVLGRTHPLAIIGLDPSTILRRRVSAFLRRCLSGGLMTSRACACTQTGGDADIQNNESEGFQNEMAIATAKAFSANTLHLATSGAADNPEEMPQ